MKAVVLRRIGFPWVMDVEDIPPRPSPRRREVLIRVVGSGVCHSDLHVALGEIPFPLPAVLGHEVSGIIEEVGPDVEGLSKGDAVVTSFIVLR
ncbi:alcohol dehydrogenase catalytic domain-containing protein [Vulcanisaeta souniana]|uniref:alcohol dehydrogenase catalytic domain-containing protein n=1 Tax=Vulcanisaeta souniana TaxID=164452 RepID=UPI0006D06500|nr:alcohol dehydrogenase catalytic domain-containing protein [Vulcanisaeta souniana]